MHACAQMPRMVCHGDMDTWFHMYEDMYNLCMLAYNIIVRANQSR